MIMTHTALERTTVDVVAVELADGISSVLVRVHLDEGKATIGLEASLDNETKILEEWNKIVLRRVGSQVANVGGSLILRSLGDNHLVAARAVCGELMVTVRSRWGDAHLRNSLLLRHGWLTLLIRPVASYRTRSEPLAIHRRQSLLGLAAVSVGNEAVATGTASLHVPHNTRFRDLTEGSERLVEYVVVDLIG